MYVRACIFFYTNNLLFFFVQLKQKFVKLSGKLLRIKVSSFHKINIFAYLHKNIIKNKNKRTLSY